MVSVCKGSSMVSVCKGLMVSVCKGSLVWVYVREV